MSDDEGVTYTRDLMLDEHWRPGSTIPYRDTRAIHETSDAVTVEASPNADDIEDDSERLRCPDCGKVPGKWQPTIGGRRSELTLEECRTCGAAWTGLSWSRIGRAKP